MEDVRQSALHDSIRTRGSNSYYYAHATTAPPEERYRSSGEPPRLLSGPSTQANSSGPPSTLRTRPVRKHAWADDGPTKVKVYVDLPQNTSPASSSGSSGGSSGDGVTVDLESPKCVVLRIRVPAEVQGGREGAGAGGAVAAPAEGEEEEMVLRLSPLFADVTAATARRTKGGARVVMTLTKKEGEGVEWPTLVAVGGGGGGGGGADWNPGFGDS